MAGNPFAEAIKWRWPVPIDGSSTKPVISDGFSRTSRGGKGHLGVDLCYPRKPHGKESLPEMTKGFYMPTRKIYAIACQEGKVWSADSKDIHGGAVKIDHGAPWLSAYRHLATIEVKQGDWVSKGQRIGLIGNDPNNAHDINHLHFELWDTSKPRKSSDDMREAFAIDPSGAMELLWDYQYEDGTVVDTVPSKELVASLRDKAGDLSGAPSGLIIPAIAVAIAYAV